MKNLVPKIGLIILFPAFFSLLPESASAFKCEAVDDGQDMKIYVGAGETKRNPNLEEIFDGMNREGSTLFEDLGHEPDRVNQVTMLVEVDGKPSVPYHFASLPKKSKGDPACKNKKITGYQCRVNDFRSKGLVGGLPNELKTGVEISVPNDEMALFQKVTVGLGCTETFLPDGRPAFEKTAPPGKKPPKPTAQ